MSTPFSMARARTRIYPAIAKLDDEEQCCCLYRGELDGDLAPAAPYLVKLDRDAELTTWLLTHGFGDSWGDFPARGRPTRRSCDGTCAAS